MTESLPTTEQTLEERGSRYGDFAEVANLTQALFQTVLQTHYKTRGDNPKSLPPFIVESIHMICNKLARAACGDPLFIENFRDISGYSQLVVNILEKTPEATDAKVVYSNPTKS